MTLRMHTDCRYVDGSLGEYYREKALYSAMGRPFVPALSKGSAAAMHVLARHVNVAHRKSKAASTQQGAREVRFIRADGSVGALRQSRLPAMGETELPAALAESTKTTTQANQTKRRRRKHRRESSRRINKDAKIQFIEQFLRDHGHPGTLEDLKQCLCKIGVDVSVSWLSSHNFTDIPRNPHRTHRSRFAGGLEREAVTESYQVDLPHGSYDTSDDYFVMPDD